MRGMDLNWEAMPLSGVFETSDGALVMVGAFKQNPVKDIGTALGIPGLEDDPRFATHALRMANKAALQTMFMERFRTNTTAHWIGKLEEQDLLCAPVRDMREALVDPQTLHNGMILEGHGNGDRPLRFIASPIAMSGATTELRRAPPRLGEHTAEIFDEARRIADGVTR